MKNYLRIPLAGFCLSCQAAPAFANFAMSPTGATNLTSFNAGGPNTGTGNCALANTECAASIPINTAGTPYFTASLPAQVSLANTGANTNKLLVTPDSVALPANQSVNVNQMGGTSINSGCVAALNGFGISIPATVCGVFGTYVLNANTNVGDNADAVAVSATFGSPVVGHIAGFNGTTWDRLQVDGSKFLKTVLATTTNAGAALAKGGVGVVNGGSFYQHVAASQTGAVLQSSTGAIGDYLSHCVIYPSTTAAGSVTVFDNANAAATNVIEFTTGTLSNLAPISIPVGAVSTAGPWKVTTGVNETVVCYGKFS